MNLRALAESKRAFNGTSKAAEKRRAEANRGTLIAGRPGETVKTRNGKRSYVVAKDGSFRRIKDQPSLSKGTAA